MTIALFRPSGKYAEQVMAFRDELQENGDGFDGCAGLEDCASFEEWICFDERLRARYKEGYVPSEIFLAVREQDDRLVGIIDYRHPLSDYLLRFWCLTDHGTENVLFRMETIKDAPIGRAFARLLQVSEKETCNKNSSLAPCEKNRCFYS